LAHPFGSKLLREICAEDLDTWMTKQIQAKYKPSTVNKHAGLLNRIFNVAVEWEYLEKNPFNKAIIKKFPTGDHVQRFLTPDEIRRLLSACSKEPHPYLHSFIKLLLLTGARSSELRLCKWSDVNLTKAELYIGLSKNGRSRRIILSDASIKELYRIKEKSESLGTPTMASNWVFTNPKTQLPYTSMQISFSKARNTARLENVRIHDLRHTFASLLINNGASIYEVQKLLGHHHVSMTERYAHLFPNTLKERAEIIASSLSDVPE
jgi:integrase